MSAYTGTTDKIMNVREIIDAAFGDFEGNVVNFKLIQAVLHLMARQLRLLERRVEVDLGPLALIPSGSTLSVTEVKIHAMQKKRKKTKDDSDKGAGGTKTKSSGGGKATGAGKRRKSERGTGTQSSSDKTSTDKTSSDKASTDKASTDKAFSDKASTYKTSSDKTSTDKTSERTTTDKTSSSGKTSTDKTSSSGKTSTHKTSSSGKTSSDKTSSDKTSSDKTSTDKTSSDRTSTDKASSDKISTDKTSTDVSTDKTLSSRTSSGRDKSSSKSSSGKSADRQATAAARAEKGSDKIMEVPEEKTTSKTSKRGGKAKSSSKGTADADGKRADSFEETITSPTPMASIGSIEAQYEKVLVVQRVPSVEARRSVENLQGQIRAPQISVVTQEQFEKLAERVCQLQSRLLPIGTPGFPERAELMQQLRRGASLTDAMAALQLSARLESTEKAIGQMASMITELARQTPGVEIDSETEALFEAAIAALGGAAGAGVGGAEVAKGGAGGGATDASGKSGGRGGSARSAKSAKGAKDKGTKDKGTKGTGRIEQGIDTGIGSQLTQEPPPKSATTYSQAGSKSQERDGTTTIAATEKSIETTEITPATQIPIPPTTTPVENEFEMKPDYITYEDLRNATKELHDNLINNVTAITSRAKTSAEQAYKLSLNLDGKIEAALTVSSRMNNLENMVSQYADQINALDTGLSSQMTNYQEQLTQMQHDLEIGLETMAEVLGNTGGDTVAVTELNSHFTSLQTDFDNMMYRQKDLKDAQDAIAFDLENLWKEIEILRDTKSDREEVVDALRDKAGIGELNGLVSIIQFDAVRGDFEKRIGAAYDKFNNQELVWQKAIDDLIRGLEEKADLVQVESLRDEINKYLTIMKARMQIISDIVGEPKSAMLSKKLFRDTACLSCGSPAHMDCEEPGLIPALPKFSARQPAEGAEAEPKAKGDRGHRICYADYPMPHPRDPRSHVCQRYCGGSHTIITEGPSRVPPAMVIQQPLRAVTTELGTNGKMYLVDEQPEKIPCTPCNKPQPALPRGVWAAEPVRDDLEDNNRDSNMTVKNEPMLDICMTPPAHQVSISE